MNDAIKNIMNTKTTDTYKIIEEKYRILIRYLQNLINENRLEIQNVECILNALDPIIECNLSIDDLIKGDKDE